MLCRVSADNWCTSRNIEELNRLVDNLATAVAVMSMSREQQNAETDPAKLADAILNKYNIAKERLQQNIGKDLGLQAY